MSRYLSQLSQNTNFSAIDWGLIILYLVFSFFVGLLVRKHVRSIGEFIVAGRSIKKYLGIATLAGSEMGLITVMYNAEQGYSSGFAALHIGIIAGVVSLIIGATGFIVAPLREYGVLTIPEFYEKRFDKKTRVLGGIMLVLGGVLNMGLFLKVGSMFIAGITGIDPKGSGLAIIMSILLFFVLAYTILGGMISVIITDYVQFIIMSLGALMAMGLSIHHLEWSNIFTTVKTTMGEKAFNPVISPDFGIDYIIWMVITAGLVSCAIWPTAVSRALSAESKEVVKKQFMWSSLGFAVRFIIPAFLGIAAYVYFQNQSPEVVKTFTKSDRLYAVPIFLGTVLPIGIVGLMTAGMLAAFMSTHDTYLLTWSSVITHDILGSLVKLTEAKKIKITRIIILILGAYILFWGLFYEGSEKIWDYMAITGAIYFTGAISVLAVGLYFKWASSAGAFAALFSGLIAVLGLSPIQKVLGFKIEPTHLGLTTVSISFATMILFSLIIPNKKAKKEET